MRTPRVSNPEDAYEAFLRRKVEAGRASMRAVRGRSHDKVDAMFAAKRKRLMLKPSLKARPTSQ